MRSMKIGKSGVEASVVGIGAWAIGGDSMWGASDDAESVRTIHRARELGVTLLRFWVLRHGVIPASRGGKLKTLLQAIAIGVYLLPLPHPWEWAAHIVMGAALVVTVVTGVEYVYQALALRRAAADSVDD